MHPVNKFGGKTAPGLPVKGAPVSKTVSPQTIPLEKAQVVKTPQNEPRSALLRALNTSGLPADKLSSSIISFARFFSLPLKPELTAAIRRQAFAQGAANSGEPAPRTNGAPLLSEPRADAAKNREALSLAAAAAESKGVELKENALETYAAAIDPDSHQRQDGEEQRQKRRNKNQNKQTEGEEQEPIAAASVKKTAVESAEKNPLLSILNRLPGKNGQKWLVFPFDFSKDGREFKVSLRLLLAPPVCGEPSTDYMALDIVENGGAGQRQVFVISAVNGAAQRLSVFLQNEISEKEYSAFVRHTERELSALLGIKPECVSVKVLKDAFPFELEHGENLLCSVDTAV